MFSSYLPSVYRLYFDFFCIVFFLYIIKVPLALLLPHDVYIYFFSFHYGTDILWKMS